MKNQKRYIRQEKITADNTCQYLWYFDRLYEKFTDAEKKEFLNSFIENIENYECGLAVGESYNKPRSEDARQPQCTPEKEEAIMQALRHYGMI